MKIAPALLFLIFPFLAVANEDGLKQIADAAESRSIGSDAIDFGPPTPLPFSALTARQNLSARF